MSKLRVGVIGLGYWGPNLVRNLKKIKEVEVKAIADISTQRLGELSNDYPAISIVTKDPYELINSGEIDAVIIATPVRTHFKLAKKSLESGKHVLVEKPMTSKVSEAEELIYLALRKKLILMVDHTFVYSAQVKKIKELIDKGDIGKLYYIDSTRINLGLFQSDINVIWDLAPHDFSIINHLVGKKPLSLSTHGINHPEDTGVGLAIGKSYFWIGKHSEVKGKNKDPYRMMFNIEVGSVEKEYKMLKEKGVKFIAKPFKAPTFDLYFATFVDLDGNIGQIVGKH